jgi:anti-sigma factor RsiW
MDSPTCVALVALVTDYLEGALTAADHQSFELHLKRCPPCGEYLAQIRQTILACGRVDLGAIDTDARAALLEAFQGWKATR